jgi:sensor histidine kinase YesM
MSVPDSPAASAQSPGAPAPGEAWRGGAWRWVGGLAGAASGTRLGLRGFWVFQGVIWSVGAVTLVGVLRNFSPDGVDGAIVTGRILTGLLLTTALHFCYRHPFTQALPSATRLLWIIALNIAAALAGSGLWMGLIELGFHEMPSDTPFAHFTSARLYSLVTWNLAYFGLELVLEHRAARLELSEAREVARAAELKQLQMQLNPHLLFNALNAVMGSLETKHQAREIVQNLADFLRFSLAEARPLEPLGRELDALESYLGLQQARFQDGLQCRIEVSPAATRVMVPPMLIQPLLENAFKYAPLSSPLPLRVLVKADIVNDWLEVQVRNSGQWLEPAVGVAQGTGLENLRRRLTLLVGERASLSVSCDSDSVAIMIRIPVDGASAPVSSFSPT